MIKSIQVGRGVSAIAVAVYHTYLIYFQKTGIAVFQGPSVMGYLAVPFFFVLSGFIIALAHHEDLDQPTKAGRYAFKRFIRVYPLYWLFSLFYVATAVAGFGDANFSWEPIHVFENIALIHITPDFIGPPLKVGWTLFYEIRFYILFGIAIVSRKLGIALFAAWLIGTVFAEPTNPFMTEFFSLLNFAFLFGIAGAYGSRHIDPKWWKVLVIAGVVMIVTCVFFADPLVLKNKRSLLILPVSLGFMLLMLGLALLEISREVKVGKLGMLLGSASYSIYLVHSAPISVIVALHGKLPVIRDIPVAVMFLPTLIIAVAAGVVAHLVVEKPLLGWLQKPLRRPREVSVPAA